MKIKVSEATNTQLDWLVAHSAELVVIQVKNGHTYVPKYPTIGGQRFTPTTDWSQGGPILSEARISRTIDHSGLWIAYWTDGYGEGDDAKKWMQCDRSELVAGLRCFVASKLGDEVEVPKELL
jgi:hypothetical protein